MTHGEKRHPRPPDGGERDLLGPGGETPDLLLREERIFEGGFAPRAIVRSGLHDAIVVGCKDGTLTVLERREGDWRARHVDLRIGGSAVGIRTLCELDDGSLLIGSSDGRIFSYRWPEGFFAGSRLEVRIQDQPAALTLDVAPSDGPVRGLGRLGDGRCYASYRRGLCLGFRPDPESPEAGRIFEDGDVQWILPLGLAPWLVIGETGRLSRWDGDEGLDPVSWPGRDEDAPATVDDHAVLSTDDDRGEIFLATEAGVFLARRVGGDGVEVERVTLRGFGGIANAVSAVSSGRYVYLWVADLRGDSHLFWAWPADLHTFYRVGVFQTDRRARLGVTWFDRASDELRVVQADWNDRLALGVYCRSSLTAPAPEGSPAYPRWLVSHGGAEELRSFFDAGDRDRQKLEKISEGISWADAGREELLLELIERLGAEPRGRRALLESLRGPHAELADAIFKEVADIAGGDARERRARQVSQRLTLALLGVIHRQEQDREEACFSLLRWLRERQRLVPPEAEDLREALQHSIRFARKWGAFGDIEGLREELVTPIAALARQEEERTSEEAASSPPEYFAERLERLTYEALLFERQVNEIARDDSGRMRGRTAWDLACREMDGRRLVAVSWRWGGIELYELHGAPPRCAFTLSYLLAPRERSRGTGEYFFAARPFTPGEVRHPGGIRRSAYGYSRALLLLPIRDRTYLVANVACGSPEVRERLYVWRVLPDGSGGAQAGGDRVWRLEEGGAAELPPGQSVYSLLDMGGGRFVAGLQGRGKIPQILVGRVVEGEGPETQAEVVLDDPVELEPPGGPRAARAGEPAHRPAGRNRVWSLARASGNENPACVRVFAGCEDGRILETVFRAGIGASAEAPPEVVAVAVLSSPVVTLACRSVEFGESERLEPAGEAKVHRVRIFAGCADSSIVCWQELERPARSGGRFASLWATHGDGPIAGLHLLDGPPRWVFATTRQGRGVHFYDDLPDPTYEAERDHPARIPFPGCRYGRPLLRGACFASVRVPFDAAETAEDGFLEPRFVLLTASDEGTLRLLGLHDPTFTAARHQRFAAICDLWWKLAKPHQMRLAEAVFRATPALGLILVRWLLDPQIDEPKLEPARHDLPRHLRPLKRLGEAWSKGAWEGEGWMAIDAEAAGTQLEIALRRAWQLNDLRLFQEICAVALKRMNDHLFRTAGKRAGSEIPAGWLEEKARARDLYLRCLAAIRQSLQRWVGAEDHKEARARIAVANHLVDGDTVLRVLREAAWERRAGDAEGPFGRILDERIEAVRQLVFKRDPLVSLETLRATNLSLMRLCFRLCRTREERADHSECYDPDLADREEVDWTVFEPFFEQLSAAAVRSFGSRIDLTDSLAHEYGRTFALAVCACPSAAMRIASRLTETQLISDPDSPEDLSRRVGRQLRLLTLLRIRPPEWAARLFHLAARPPDAGVDPLGEMRAGLEGLPALGDLQKRYGDQNGEDLFCLRELYDVALFFNDLATRFATTAQGLELTRAKVGDLQKRLDDGLLGSLYRHSRAFWLERLEDLVEDRVWGAVPDEPSLDKIRPEMVLFGRRLIKWADESLDDLDERYRSQRIFQPEYPIFKRIFARLRSAAEGLPRSAALQRNLVVGILGHHLLEDLDEHVLELEEIAYAVAPAKVRDLRSGAEPPQDPGAPDAIADRFADYLVRRARRAADIPKNLRTLHALADASAAEARRAGISFKELARCFFPPVNPKGEDFTIEDPGLRFLTLVLDELEKNHRSTGPDAGGPTAPEIEISRKPSPTGEGESPRIAVAMTFPCRPEDIERLEAIAAADLQTPFRFPEIRGGSSGGMGLYLANLAAASAGWRLRIDEIVKKRPCHVVFELSKIEDDTDRRPPGTARGG